METQIRELIRVLRGQLALYHGIEELLVTEHKALASGKPDAVLGLVRRKETMLLQVRTLEESREWLSGRMARAWHMRADDMTLRVVEEHSPEALRGEMAEVRENLRACLERVAELNKTNARFCSQGIETIGEIMQAARDTQSRQEKGYGNKRHAGAEATSGIRVTT